MGNEIKAFFIVVFRAIPRGVVRFDEVTCHHIE